MSVEAIAAGAGDSPPSPPPPVPPYIPGSLEPSETMALVAEQRERERGNEARNFPDYSKLALVELFDHFCCRWTTSLTCTPSITIRQDFFSARLFSNLCDQKFILLPQYPPEGNDNGFRPRYRPTVGDQGRGINYTDVRVDIRGGLGGDPPYLSSTALGHGVVSPKDAVVILFVLLLWIYSIGLMFRRDLLMNFECLDLDFSPLFPPFSLRV